MPAAILSMLPTSRPVRVTGWVALRIAYLGSGFFGFTKQPGLRTVQGELEDALLDLGYLAPGGRLRVSSRTDRGVSALDNVVVFRANRDLTLGRLNDRLPEDLTAWALASLSGPGDLRCLEKVYLYSSPSLLVPSKSSLVQALEEARSMGGVAFCREGDAPFPEIGLLDLFPLSRALIFRGERFCWEMIRRIVGFALELSVRGRRIVRPAPAGGLLLLRTECEGARFKVDLRQLRRMADRFSKFAAAWAGQAILLSLAQGVPDVDAVISSSRSPFGSPRRTT